ncbi:MAG: hypothetical protein ACXVSJ_17420, partial [Solirubrobacteraceae bacterium]
WLDANGHRGVPLDINEFGAAAGVTSGSAAWGAQVAQYTQWALCTPALLVENVQAFWWGAVPLVNTSPWFAMVDSGLSPTPLGTAYLAEASALTSQGCPAAATSPPTVSRTTVPTSKRAKPHKTRKPAKRSHHRKRRRPVKTSHPDKRRHPAAHRHRRPVESAARPRKPHRTSAHR